MASGKDDVQCKHLLGMKRRRFKCTPRAVPTQKFTGTETGKNEHKDQEGCPATNATSELNAGLEVDEYNALLKAQADKLKLKTCKLSRKLQKRAAMCMELKDANRLLMDELKKMCEPCVIQTLEAKNPENNPQIDQEKELSETDS